MPPDDAAAWGVVPLVGRGALPFETLHGVGLWRHALAALTAVVPDTVLLVEDADAERCRTELASARVLTAATWPDAVRRAAGRALLVHDPLCPLVPEDLLADFCTRAAAQPGTSFVAYRPVTDTVKTAVDGRIVGTIDRERLAALASPVLVAATAVRDDLPLGDPQQLLHDLRRAGPTELVVAPSIARRVDDGPAVLLLECVDELERRLRHAPRP